MEANLITPIFFRQNKCRGPIMQMNEILRSYVGPDYADERTNRGMVNGRGTPVGRDLSPPPPIDRPVGNPPPTQMNVLKLIIPPHGGAAGGGMARSAE